MSDDAAGIGGLSGLAGASGVPGGPHRGWIFAVIGGVLPVALLAAIVAVPAALWSRLPARVADHWTFTGTANGSSPRLVAFAALGLPAVLGACLVGLGWAVTRNGARTGASRRGRTAGVPAAGLVSIGLFLMAISAASVIVVAVANLGGRGLGSASVGPGGLIGIVGGPALLAFSAGYGLRRHGGGGTADSGTPRSSLGLRAGERAAWTGRARAGWAWPAAVLLLAGGLLAGTVTAQWALGGALLAAGVAGLNFTSVRVTVAARGVMVGYGALGLRLTRIPLRRIASAAAVEQTAFTFGYRGSLLLFGTALVALRRGPALRLTLRDGKLFTVTVDDAATGAALLNDLIAAAAIAGASGL
jgi:Protein of unknown function (DUF1648)